MIAIQRVESESDFARLYDLFVEYEADLPPNLRHGTIPEPAVLMQSYAGANAAFLAISEGDAIGCVGLREYDLESAAVLRLYVKPSSRGLGAARSLVTTAIAFARAQGRRRIVLDTHKDALKPAYRLYRSLGFEECEPLVAVTYECPTFMELKI